MSFQCCFALQFALGCHYQHIIGLFICACSCLSTVFQPSLVENCGAVTNIFWNPCSPDGFQVSATKASTAWHVKTAKQETKICGWPAAKALLDHRLKSVNRLYFTPEMRKQLGSYCSELAKDKKSYAEKSWTELTKMARNDDHDGIVIAAQNIRPIHYKPKFLSEWQKAGESILIADSLASSKQLGRIIHSAACFGIKRILLSETATQLIHATKHYFEAEGATEHVRFYQIESIRPLIRPLNDAFITLYLGGEGAQKTTQFKKPIHAPGRPNAIIVSNGQGKDSNKVAAICAHKLKVNCASSNGIQISLEETTSIILAWLYGNGTSSKQIGTFRQKKKKSKLA